MNTRTSNDTLLLNKAFGCKMAKRRTLTETSGDPNETDVRNLSESNFKEVIVVFDINTVNGKSRTLRRENFSQKSRSHGCGCASRSHQS
jgi:hypothetical protein